MSLNVINENDNHDKISNVEVDNDKSYLSIFKDDYIQGFCTGILSLGIGLIASVGILSQIGSSDDFIKKNTIVYSVDVNHDGLKDMIVKEIDDYKVFLQQKDGSFKYSGQKYDNLDNKLGVK